MPVMTVHIGLTDLLTIAGNAVRCLFQFKQLNLGKYRTPPKLENTI
jgi:hypothetical protein